MKRDVLLRGREREEKHNINFDWHNGMLIAVHIIEMCNVKEIHLTRDWSDDKRNWRVWTMCDEDLARLKRIRLNVDSTRGWLACYLWVQSCSWFDVFFVCVVCVPTENRHPNQNKFDLDCCVQTESWINCTVKTSYHSSKVLELVQNLHYLI